MCKRPSTLFFSELPYKVENVTVSWLNWETIKVSFDREINSIYITKPTIYYKLYVCVY